MKTYIIRREDYFKPNGAYFVAPYIFYAGSLWMTVYMTDEQVSNYPYPISKA